jgi:putative membrane protein
LAQTHADAYEIAASRLALQRSRNRQIKAFAQMMIAHHTRSAAELARLQGSGGLQRQAPQSEPKGQMLQKLRDSKANFDTNYIQGQVAAHEEALELHRTYAGNGQNVALRHFAQRAIPTVQEHLVKARGLKPRR